MTISLHSALVPSWQRILGACQGWLDKAEAHAGENGLSEAEMLDARLITDMLPFNYQVKSMVVHSKGAVEGLRAGSFSPDMSEPPASFAALRDRVAEALAFLDGLDPAELDGMVGKPMAFTVPAANKRLDFTAEDFLFSFSQSNFYFHSVTAYGILRMKGVNVGKIDYLGRLPIIA